MDRSQLRIGAGAVAQFAGKLGIWKTEVMIALFEAGMDQGGKLRRKDGCSGK